MTMCYAFWPCMLFFNHLICYFKTIENFNLGYGLTHHTSIWFSLSITCVEHLYYTCICYTGVLHMYYRHINYMCNTPNTCNTCDM